MVVQEVNKEVDETVGFTPPVVNVVSSDETVDAVQLWNMSLLASIKVS